MKGLSFFCALFLWCVTLSIAAYAEETITLTNGEWPPYFSEEFVYGGVGSRICKKAFALEGIDVEYEFLPWKRGLKSAELGQYAGSLGWRKTPEREKVFHFSTPLISVDSVFFHRKGSSFDWETLDDVGSMTVGATLGYTYIEMLRPYIEKYGGKLDIAPNDEMNLHKLAAGRIDLFPCAKAVGYYILRTKALPGTGDLIRHHPKPILEGEIYLVISKKQPRGKDLIKRFNRGLKKLKESGLYDRYLLESIRGDYLPE